MNLRESNVTLREQELQRKKEIEELDRARTAMAEEVMKLERARVGITLNK